MRLPGLSDDAAMRCIAAAHPERASWVAAAGSVCPSRGGVGVRAPGVPAGSPRTARTWLSAGAASVRAGRRDGANVAGHGTSCRGSLDGFHSVLKRPGFFSSAGVVSRPVYGWAAPRTCLPKPVSRSRCPRPRTWSCPEVPARAAESAESTWRGRMPPSRRMPPESGRPRPAGTCAVGGDRRTSVPRGPQEQREAVHPCVYTDRSGCRVTGGASPIRRLRSPGRVGSPCTRRSRSYPLRGCRPGVRLVL